MFGRVVSLCRVSFSRERIERKRYVKESMSGMVEDEECQHNLSSVNSVLLFL